MAKIFLDTNTFIDLVESRGNLSGVDLQDHELVISPLSIHILIYVTRKKIPYPTLSHLIKLFSITVFDQSVCERSLIGTTKDFEDNVQLHSASDSGCDLFITRDQKLLSLQFFGAMRIAQKI
ncbi:MAG: PIN domain-containing protein [Patescibacteria group bacterium]